MDTAIFNHGLTLALEFGTHWLEPIQDRLRHAYPGLTAKELDEYNSVCSRVMSVGHKLIMKELKQYKSAEEVNQLAVSNKVKTTLLAKYPSISESNLSTIVSQGFYYAWKDGYR